MKFYNVIEFYDVDLFDGSLKILRNVKKYLFSLIIFSELKKCYKLIYSDKF